MGLNNDIQTDTSGASIKSTYGWLKPVRFETKDPSIDLLAYPKSTSGISTEEIRKVFEWNENGFSTPLAMIKGNQYRGVNAAGGDGETMDLDTGGKPDVVSEKKCHFMFQLNNDRIHNVETDRNVIKKHQGKTYHLSASEPITL